MLAAVRARAVHKRFGPVEALRGVDLGVRQGEVVALLGANGAGKSTLLRILATLVTPDTGSVEVAGHDAVRAGRAVRASVGLLLSEERSWYVRLSGRRNLEFFAALRGLRGAPAARRAGLLLDRVGLTAAADRPVAGYSAGMRARLAMARALLGDPAVLLLDEATRSLDAESVERLGDLIGEATHERRAAVVLATHDESFASALGARTVTLDAGRVREAPASDLVSR